MSAVQSAKKVAEFLEPEQRGLQGCHNCRFMRMMPSHLGRRQSECSRLGCYVSPMAVCKHHEVKPTLEAPT